MYVIRKGGGLVRPGGHGGPVQLFKRRPSTVAGVGAAHVAGPATTPAARPAAAGPS